MIEPEIIMEEVTLSNIKERLKEWYNESIHHYITVNATDNGEALTLDWIFSEYEVKNRIFVFRAENIDYGAFIPSMMDINPNSWISEWDLADMFDLDMEDASKGMFLEPDAPRAPLRKGTYSGK